VLSTHIKLETRRNQPCQTIKVGGSGKLFVRIRAVRARKPG